MSSWRIVFTRQAQKDAKKLAASALRPKAEAILALLAADPFRKPPGFEKLMGDLAGAYSRRLNWLRKILTLTWLRHIGTELRLSIKATSG